MAKLKPEQQNSSSSPKAALPKSSKTIILLIVSAFLLLAVGAYAWLKLAGPGAPVANDNQNASQVDNGPFRTGPAADPLEADADGDGLTDQAEADLKTDPAKPDSDADGLSDLDEAKGYGTNPLEADTDGDGFKDGDEVANRYDPNGPGQLLDLDSAANTNSTP